MVQCIDEAGRILAVSDKWLDKLGYRRAEVLGLATVDFLSGDSRDRAITVIQPAFSETGACENIALQMVCKDGRRLDVLMSAFLSPARAPGAGRHAIAVITDVSILVETQRRLRESEQRVSVAADSGRIGIWEWDVIKDSMVWDAWMDRFFDVPEDDKRDALEIWIDRLHPDDRIAADLLVDQAIAGTALFDTEYRVIWRDGSTHHIRATGQIIRDEAGRAVRMVGSNWDVTEQRQLAAAFAQEHELLRVTLESIGDGVITTDAKGNVTWLNPVAERMTGWTSAAAAGHRFEQVFNIVHAEAIAL